MKDLAGGLPTPSPQSGAVREDNRIAGGGGTALARAACRIKQSLSISCALRASTGTISLYTNLLGSDLRICANVGKD